MDPVLLLTSSLVNPSPKSSPLSASSPYSESFRSLVRLINPNTLQKTHYSSSTASPVNAVLIPIPVVQSRVEVDVDVDEDANLKFIFGVIVSHGHSEGKSIVILDPYSKSPSSSSRREILEHYKFAVDSICQLLLLQHGPQATESSTNFSSSTDLFSTPGDCWSKDSDIRDVTVIGSNKLPPIADFYGSLDKGSYMLKLADCMLKYLSSSDIKSLVRIL